jgi:hypothetical protein
VDVWGGSCYAISQVVSCGEMYNNRCNVQGMLVYPVTTGTVIANTASGRQDGGGVASLGCKSAGSNRL